MNFYRENIKCQSNSLVIINDSLPPTVEIKPPQKPRLKPQKPDPALFGEARPFVLPKRAVGGNLEQS